MNPIDILGGILGKRSGGGGSAGGLGGSILESVLRGGRPGSSQPSGGNARVPGRPPGSPEIIDPPNPGQEFDSLEDLLRNAHQRHASRRSAPTQRRPESLPLSEPQVTRRNTDFQTESTVNPSRADQQAEVLVRAMINAAKSDGQIDQSEQDAIIQQLGELSAQDKQYLRTEFARPLDVREFVWSVPLGMEHQVYAISLMAIRLDSNAEGTYLKQLAHGFRMTADVCSRIHQEYGAPVLR